VATAILGSTWMQVRIPFLTGQLVDCYLTPYANQMGESTAVNPVLANLSATVADAFADSSQANCSYTAVGNTDFSGFTNLVLLMVAYYVASAILTGITFYTMSIAGFGVLRDIRHDVFRHIHRLSMGY